MYVLGLSVDLYLPACRSLKDRRAAVKPIIEEAGGAFCAWDGTATIYGGSALAMPAALRAPVLAALATRG